MDQITRFQQLLDQYRKRNMPTQDNDMTSGDPTADPMNGDEIAQAQAGDQMAKQDDVSSKLSALLSRNMPDRTPAEQVPSASPMAPKTTPEAADDSDDDTSDDTVLGGRIPRSAARAFLSSRSGIPMPSRRIDSSAALLAAQEGANNNELTTNLARAGSQIGAAIAGVKPDYSTIDAVAKNNQQGVENQKLFQTNRAQDMKLSEADLDLGNATALNDPNHPISAAAREAAGKYLKIKLPDDVSAAMLDKAGLLKPLVNALRQNGMTQIVKQVGSDGKVHNILIDKSTGEQHILGESGFAAQRRIDPDTGRIVTYSGSDLGGTPTAISKPTLKPGETEVDPIQRKAVADATKQAEQSEEFKTAEKTLTSSKNIRALLDDVKKHGGQSLAMLGAKFAKGPAGEVGMLTERDVTRYIQNPELLGGAYDTFLKWTQGKLSDVSLENMNRLLDILEKDAIKNKAAAYDKAATQVARNYQVPKDEATYRMNPDSPEKAQSASGMTPEQRRARIEQLRSELGTK